MMTRWLLVLAATTLVTAGCRDRGGAPAPPTAGFVVDDPALVAENNRGVGLMGRFEYEPAHDVFAELVRREPAWLDAKVNLGIATLNRQKEGDEARALALFDEVLAVDDGHLQAHYCAGLLRLRNGEVDPAGAHFRAVAAGDPADAYAAYSVGQCVEGTDLEDAARWYEKAIGIDPYLRSAYYRAFQILQRLGRSEQAQAYFEEFQRLENNPRARLVEVKYTRMGPKAEVQAIDLAADAPPAARPDGAPFAEAVPLVDADVEWAGARSVTAVDLDADGALDVFVAGGLNDGAHNAVIMNRGDAGFELDERHALAEFSDVRAALWGDVDNDGKVDVYLCRRGSNHLLRQETADVWRSIGGVSGGDLDTVDGAIFDADHDGDLDVFLVNADGPNALLNNNRDGTFTDIAPERGIAGDGRGSRQVIPVDLDRDRDLDLVVLNDEPPHEIYRNDRLWRYEKGVSGWETLAEQPWRAAAAGDLDADGDVELYGQSSDGSVSILTAAAAPRRWYGGEDVATPTVALTDVTGSGVPRVLCSSSGGWLATPNGSGQPLFFVGDANGTPLSAWAPVVLDAERGPSIVAVRDGAPPLVWRPGPGRHAFATLAFTGKEDTADSMRSNASGIGTRVAARIGSRWVMRDVIDGHSGPGQSLLPVTIGLGGAPRVDFVSIDWSDGVFQSELALEAGGPHVITETQRQLSSCPVLFAWNGETYEFVSDLLGVGGIGYLLDPDTFSTPRPRERFLFPPGALVPRDDGYALMITEPMEEACYLDAVALHVYDLPSDVMMTLDERMRISGPEPTGEPVFFRRSTGPVRAVNDRGEDVTARVRDADGDAAPVGPLDERFIGRLVRDHELTLEFGVDVDRIPGARLVIDGWVEYPYSQTMFAAWQASAEWRAPTLHARGADGRWTVVLEQFGYPAGMPRQMSVPLPALPAGTRALRLTTNQEIYWDRVAVVRPEPSPPGGARHVLTPSSSRLSEVGFPRRITHAQRRPDYDWGTRAPFWDTRHQRGYYTAYGPVDELVEAADDAVAIFGPGEGVEVVFPALAPLPADSSMTRHFVLEVAGWCKDMDLFTRDGETLAPLPTSGKDPDRRDSLHRRYQTRYASGR
jgi:tetratricopeptide (TPR) repeat protein